MISNNKIKIELPESEVLTLIKVYEDKASRLSDELKDANNMVSYFKGILNKGVQVVSQGSFNRVTSIASTSEGINSEIEKLPNGYIKQWAWSKKIIFILKEVGKPMTVKEIANYVFANLEPELQNEAKRTVSTISGQISAMYSKKAAQFNLKREKNEIEDYIYSISDSLENVI